MISSIHKQDDHFWDWDGNTLIQITGLYQITPDPVYGYYCLTTQENPTESIMESTIMHDLMLYADTLCIDEGCPHHSTIHICTSS